MTANNWKNKLQFFDERRDVIVPGNAEETVKFCTEQFLAIGKEAIEKRGLFSVAFSGGTTPQAIFRMLSSPLYCNALDWEKVLCFWSDERSAPPDSVENNYFAAMQSGLGELPLRKENIFRMHAETDIEKNATSYESLIRTHVPSSAFDLVMLGMGEDGHTASLFPNTAGLSITNHLVVANYVPQKNTWRMSFTYTCIHMARVIAIYVIGGNKADMVAKVFSSPYAPENLPIQKIGTTTHKAIWIMDTAASSKIETEEELRTL